MILELEKLSRLCEEKINESQQLERQRFYEGMAVAYTTIALKLKGGFDYIEPAVIDELYSSMEKVRPEQPQMDTCSFCRQPKKEMNELVAGPGVSICGDCLSFGKEVLESQRS
ncbi:hypothetical protein BTO30_10695 [Domibacillus antri]|uniref:ClpX-type ZB domain-containing protein n=1 Tax=Domibacillus antri TaxID=1714264 RepID=A0A1Q8Q4N1_9BACI|nr:hypothetical protein BTO30_10695 [Domibacillus antri]